jgi:hypothetical protein
MINKVTAEVTAEIAVETGPARRGLGEAVGEVWRLLKKGIDFPLATHTKLHTELRELAGPHMPVLVHKRAKIAETRGPLEDENWFGELGDFVTRMLWPYIEESPALGGRSKNCVAEMLDEIVASEQRSMTELALADILPRTSRFDTSWAS